MPITENDIKKIKELRDKGLSGQQIAKEIHRRKQDTLFAIRQIEGKKKKRISILTKKEQKFIDELTREQETSYKIVKDFEEQFTTKKRKWNKKRRDKVIKQIKKSKKKIKKENLKKINNELKDLGLNCNFNYITPHHVGYQFNSSCNYMIYYGITDSEVNDIIESIINILNRLHSKVKCNQRINYTSLEYIIYFNDGSTDESKISTNINTYEGLATFDNMINQISDIVYWLVNIIHQAQSPKEIKIYNIIYVNYDFKSNVR